MPLAAIQVVSAQQAETLGEHGVTDIDGLVNTSVDDLVEFLDVSLDEAEKILGAARSVIEVRERSLQAATTEGSESAVEAGAEESAASSHEAGAEATIEAGSAEDETAAGYDEAVEQGVPFSAEANIRAENSADPVALTEADPMTVDELMLQDAGRDLRPDVITPEPDLGLLATEDSRLEDEVDAAAETRAPIGASPATETSSALESSSDETAATDESFEDEKQ